LKNTKDTIREYSLEITSLNGRLIDLQQRYDEANDALEAIRSGSVDALVISGEQGESIYTLQGAEYTYRVLVESINEGALTLLEDGTILYCNQCFADMLKTPLEAVIGSKIHSYITTDCQPVFQALFAQAMSQGCRGEITLGCQDGDCLPAMVSLNVYRTDTVLKICMIAADITEQKKAQELAHINAVRAETMSSMSRSLVEAGADEQAILNIITHSAVFLLGGACVIGMVTDDGQRIKLVDYYHPDQDMHKIFKDISSQVPFPVGESISERVIRNGESLFYPTVNRDQIKVIFKQEYEVWANRSEVSSLIVVPIKARDRGLGALAMIRLANCAPYMPEDLKLTERLANQMALAILNARLYRDLEITLQKEQAMRQQLIQAEKHTALSRMMASVAHEINNPIQTVMNLMFLARSSIQDGSSSQEFLDMATSEVERISRLVTNLRDIYRPAKVEPMRPLELLKILSLVQTLLKPHLQHQKVSWQQATTDSKIWIDGIPDQLKQVFLNISLNAIEAMQPDGGTLAVSTALSPSQDQVAVAFQDTGPGIPPENLTKVFEPFFTTKSNGTGLGLAICYEIIQRHKGSITVQNSPGQGALITIWMPLLPYPAS
jgi:PAS domain S-box-containing protein